MRRRADPQGRKYLEPRTVRSGRANNPVLSTEPLWAISQDPVEERGPLAPPEVRLWWLLLAVAAVLRFVIMPYGGYPTDIATFKAWATDLAQHGPHGFYRPGFFADYLPGYLYVLWGIGRLHSVLRLNDQALLFLLKLPAALAEMGTAALIRSAAVRFASPQRAFQLGVLYLFHPTVIFTGAYWGQVDSVGGLIGLGALVLFLRGNLLTWSVAAVAFLVKPQAAPLLLLLPTALISRTLLARRGRGAYWPQLPHLLEAGLLGLGTITLLILPFGLGWMSVAGLLRRSIAIYPYSSVVAFNLWGALQGFWHSDNMRILGVSTFLWGLFLCGVTIVGLLWTVWRRPDDRTVILAAAAALVATFVLLTRMHERYLVPALAILALAVAVDHRMWTSYIALSALSVLNVVYAYTRPYLHTFTVPAWFEATIFSDVSLRLMSAMAVLALLALLKILWRPANSA